LLQGGSPLLLREKSIVPTDDERVPATVRTEQSSAERLAEEDTQTFRIEVGYVHGVKPGNIVGAIANEAGLDGEHIGHIEINNEFSLVDLPIGMPNDVFKDLRKVRVCGQPLNISRLGRANPGKPDKPKKPPKPKKNKKGAKDHREGRP
jgi:ATP-dependent RNA helicase DeaD